MIYSAVLVLVCSEVIQLYIDIYPPFLKKNYFIYLFIFDYTGSLLPRLSLVAESKSYSLHHSVRASHCGSFSCI